MLSKTASFWELFVLNIVIALIVVVGITIIGIIMFKIFNGWKDKT